MIYAFFAWLFCFSILRRRRASSLHNNFLGPWQTVVFWVLQQRGVAGWLRRLSLADGKPVGAFAALLGLFMWLWVLWDTTRLVEERIAFFGGLFFFVCFGVGFPISSTCGTWLYAEAGGVWVWKHVSFTFSHQKNSQVSEWQRAVDLNAQASIP